jgi:hypothetical protein
MGELIAASLGSALYRLEPLPRLPYCLSPGCLQVDPTFDELRAQPRFQKLVEGTA